MSLKDDTSGFRAGDNPFRTERIERLAFRLPPGETREGLMGRLRGLSFRAAVVGGHGSGKTTFLDHMSPWLEAAGFRVRRALLNEETRRLSPSTLQALRHDLNSMDCVLLDGAEQLSSWSWCCFRFRLRRAGGLIVTSHRAGRLPTLIEFRPTPDLLSDLMSELAPDQAQRPALDATDLFAGHAGNVRNALLACYDACAGR